MKLNVLAATVAALTITVAAAGVAAHAATTDGRPSSARATLHLADGTEIGTVRFRERRESTQVDVELEVPAGATSVHMFHGFHVHTNDNPANGDGCQADPATPSATWFVSADGHFRQDGQLHGDHDGDMPSLHLNDDGTAETSFAIDRIDVDDLRGRAVILHAGRDNFGNVPVGTDRTQYTANSSEATDRTSATGNAGDRVACGEITVR